VGKCQHRWEDGIGVVFRKIDCAGKNYIDLVQDKFHSEIKYYIHESNEYLWHLIYLAYLGEWNWKKKV
jgi:hypothetical protein